MFCKCILIQEMICQETVDTLLTFRGTQLLTYYSQHTALPILSNVKKKEYSAYVFSLINFPYYYLAQLLPSSAVLIINLPLKIFFNL